MMIQKKIVIASIVGYCTLAFSLNSVVDAQDSVWETGKFHWKVGPPILSVSQERLPNSEAPWVAVKDPSVVRFDGKWHLFCTLRNQKTGKGRIRIGYCNFGKWSEANQADWHLLDLTMDYHGAPQIFFFEPDQRWYLIYQAADESRGLKYGPCYSYTATIDDPTSWSKPEPLYVVPEGKKAGLDYWVICDQTHAHLLFTSLDGRIWHSQTALNRFPQGDWTTQQVVLEADLFEASHTYKMLGQDQFLTLVEAQDGRRRYFKFFTAIHPAGPWRPLAATRGNPAVSVNNVVNQDQSWATSYSHGEILRSGYNQHLEIDPKSVQLIFQGANDQEYQRGQYGDITWQLGLLQLVDAP
ncbi:non-reducing end alpha-L-arabinofuranosidase family hydrolase [Roseiconus lacunae]|uniref:non-reducing end alpha-L-arabinofuranosidase family hydrolase n=1 Tax=Roseiconus lacunae TaxID=2605694 RepID=UPI003085B177|nr:non-reducing end alpha-L-arabinofuranosidase family hydrolase [Stieleria sp. HD01]